MAKYARKLTRQELIEGGITAMTKDGRIWKNGEEITEFALDSSGYKKIFIYDRDENGCCIKAHIDEKCPGHYTYKQRTISLNRAMIAWFYGEIADGLVADHIDNNKDNYNLDNLEATTPGRNVNKEKEGWHTSEIKCKLDRPRKYYEDKLAKYTAIYEKAKQEGNAEGAHKARCNVSQTRARLRYYDNHIQEVNDMIQDKKDLTMIKALKIQYKKEGDKVMWHQLAQIEKNWNKYSKELKEEIIKAILKK